MQLKQEASLQYLSQATKLFADPMHGFITARLTADELKLGFLNRDAEIVYETLVRPGKRRQRPAVAPRRSHEAV